jgi:4-hydroxy-2-oxoglutarate aldolase
MADTVSMAGVFPPIPTPFDPSGELDLEGLAGNLAWWNQYPMTGYVVLGSNGEMPFLSEAEKLRVIDTVRNSTPGGKLLIAGCGCESAHGSIAFVRKAASAGAGVALIITPSYYKSKMDNAALADFYTRIADASPIPISLYNMPGNTGVDMTAELAIKMSQHQNIAGMKDSSGNLAKLGEVIRNARPGFQVLAGSAGFFYPALCIGAVGAVMALANIAPQKCCDLLETFKLGKHEEARQLQLRLIAANTAVTTGFGVPGLKAALEMIGRVGGNPRSPLLPLNDDQRGKLRKILQDAGILSL